MIRFLVFLIFLMGGLAGLADPPGLAARYPGDAGIDQDPAVLFAETFEAGTLDAVTARWTHVANKDGAVLALAPGGPAGSPGATALQMTATKGQNVGGHLWKLFTPGVDVMYARFYVKFADDHPYVHHFAKIGAWKDSPNWPKGEAGYRHAGDTSFQTGIEPGSGWGRYVPPGAWGLYTYWQEMRSWQGPQGASFYGNVFAPAAPALAPRDRWQCVEFMVKANSAPDVSDGEQAFWIDGKLVGRWAPGTPKGRWQKDKFVIDDAGQPFPGFRWRSTPDLKINTFWLLYYMEAAFRDNNPQMRLAREVKADPARGRVWFDHIVVATEYIGPVTAK